LNSILRDGDHGGSEVAIDNGISMSRWVFIYRLAGAVLVAAAHPLNAQSTPANGVGSQFEMVFWQSISNSDDRAQYEAYLSQYPSGTFAALARAKINAVDRRGVTIAATPLPEVVPVTVTPQVSASIDMPVAAAPSPVTASTSSSLSEQLRALSKSQGLGDSKMPAVARKAELPERPRLPSLSSSSLPAQFCTAVERNAHYDTIFKPSVDRADANNRTAVDHMKNLRIAYDEAAARGDAVSANVFAAEAKAYEAIAKAAYDTRATYDAEFNRLMAVPIVKC
jgi:hypothetical protein